MDLPPCDYSIAVRSLCEFTARSGDLSVRFTPAPTAQQGILGHRTMAARRAPHYESEVTLEGRHRSLAVRGRADGYDPKQNRLEEFKTHRGDLARMPSNQRGLHWAQLKIYGALLCAARALDRLELSLVYFDVRSEEETALVQTCDRAELAAHFASHCEAFLAWALQEVAHRARRAACLRQLAFPFDGLRSGQRRMAEAVYRLTRDGGRLMVEAPTGIGKTLATLFPALKAWPARELDKIFFLAAKTPGRKLALGALQALDLAGAPAALRVLELASRESACVYPGRACEAADCPLAAGFYDRLPQARQLALQRAILDQAAVREVAAAAAVCPYYLTQELVRWCDVIIGDYNYYFDSSAILHGLSAQNQWRVGVLVDEAHNLVPRARDMYSAVLDPAALETALPVGPARVAGQLRRLRRAWQRVTAGRNEDYFAAASIPGELVAGLQGLTAILADELAEAGQLPAALLRMHFDALQFCRLAEAFGSHSLFDVTRVPSGARLCIRNVCPAPFLAPRFAASEVAVLFSATLSPPDFYRQLLGLPADTPCLEIESPFDARQLEVHIQRGISTRWRDRPRSLSPIADLMARQVRTRPGNYMAFFSSFEYLNAVFKVFTHDFPSEPAWAQQPAMGTVERDEFLARFTNAGRGIGFAVLGGLFGEGIDLPGDRLIGAFIATLGLPRVDAVNAQIERRMQTLFQAGYEYTYLYPGLQKVVQAAGRVIRTASDRGTVHLIDDRYGGQAVRRLLPGWWRVECP